MANLVVNEVKIDLLEHLIDKVSVVCGYGGGVCVSDIGYRNCLCCLCGKSSGLLTVE